MSLLTSAQRTELAALVQLFIGDPPMPGALQTLVGFEALNQKPNLNSPRTARWLVDFTLRQRDPGVFLRLVDLCDESGTLQDVSALVTQLRSGAINWDPPVSAMWVPVSKPFVDREGFRDILTRMARGEGPAAITIEGGTGQGKQTMAEYIRLLAAGADRSFVAVAKELRRDPNPGVLELLVAEVRDELGLGLAEDPTHTEPERRAQVFARGLMLDASTAPVPVWFVINVIDVTGLEPGLLRFVDELLSLVQQMPPGSSKVRVVLLTEAITLLNLANAPPADARFVLPEIGKPAVLDWLRLAVPGRPEPLYELSATQVIERAAAKPAPSRLGWLALQCKGAHHTLVATDDG
jgi:hypothetical protein